MGNVAFARVVMYLLTFGIIKVIMKKWWCWWTLLCFTYRPNCSGFRNHSSVTDYVLPQVKRNPFVRVIGSHLSAMRCCTITLFGGAIYHAKKTTSSTGMIRSFTQTGNGSASTNRRKAFSIWLSTTWMLPMPVFTSVWRRTEDIQEKLV